MFRNLRKSSSEETIDERVNIVSQKRKKTVNVIKILNIYKIIISTNKSWKSFGQAKNEIIQIVFLLYYFINIIKSL